MKPLAIDIYAGLGGWTEGLLDAGFEVIGFDIERHVYGAHRYPAQLVLQDARTLHGSQFKDAALIVASSPCQEYSYMAMPFGRGKQIARALRGQDEFPEGYTGSRTLAELNALFDVPKRIQREAIAAAGHHIPMVQENVRGAIPWVGRSAWNFGSYHLWGDVPALMPIPHKAVKLGGLMKFNDVGFNVQACRNMKEENRKCGGGWFGFGNDRSLMRQHSSKSTARKAASAQIAKIPYPLASFIARTYYPHPCGRSEQEGT